MNSSLRSPSNWAIRALSGLLLLGVGSCLAPVPFYAPAQLLSVPAGQPGESTLSLAGCQLCQGVGTAWDSVLVVLPYTPPAAVRALYLANYRAISGILSRQEFNEGTCTLVM